ncbi:TniQ family protein [Amycolatopsis roodepoortensis]|uniref:TniQ family protein n=1 Tax=Amycolatopsis roodepoortensis TaxID=700274 RepID=UPI00214C1348|nr:TniQ family protein [Amycolatopsis roodepoortensis]UUV28597.1 TniQ family protein [Amycolatopsis roodepoortensis]
MTVVITTLPLRVPVLAGESLDSWLHALAQRHNSSPGQLLAALGLGRGQRWIRRLIDEPDPRMLRRLEQTTGLPPGRLDATLGSVAGPAGLVDRLATHGSRFCPACLAESGGRWMSSWRLNWSTACLRHERLLADVCPDCGSVPRRTLVGGITATPATACPSRPGRVRRCGGDFTAAHTTPAPAAVLAAQRWIDHVTATACTPGNDRTGAEQALAEDTLRDLRYVTNWLLRLNHKHLAGEAGILEPRRRANPLSSNGSAAKLDAALAAILLTRAQRILGENEQAAIAELATTVTGQPLTQRIPPPRGPDQQWPTTSPRFAHRYLRAVDAELIASDRLRTRSLTPQAARPVTDTAARARMIPQQLWPDWSSRLLPPAGYSAGLFRAALAALLLLPGARARTMSTLAAALNPRVTRAHMSAALQGLAQRDTGPALEGALTLLCRIADHLDQTGAPIDYQRRREVVPIDLIDWPAWQELACSAKAHPGELRFGRRARLLHVQRHLHHLLTGSDLDNPAHPLHFHAAADRSQYIRFTTTLTPQLRHALHRHAESVLPDLGIDEPATWSPPAELADGLELPGIDVGALDIDKISRLLIDEQRPASEVADLLGVHIEHIRLALERLDRNRDDEPAAVGYWRREQQAMRLLTREFFEREYVHGRRSLGDLAAETGFRRGILARYAREAGITLRRGGPPIPIDPDWLRVEYHDRKRPLSDLAGEVGVAQMTIHKALTEFGIPTRPRGVGSRTEMITTLDDRVPTLIRSAVEGTLHGWQRLHRFQVTMAFPTIDTAAGYLNTLPNSLVHQLDKLEKSLGSTLFHRAAVHKPHQPTELGQQLLHQLKDPHVQQLMATALHPDLLTLPDTSTIDHARQHNAAPAKRPRLRPYPDIPVTRLRMTRATLAVLADLRARHPAEFYGHELHQRLGLHHGTIYPLLNQLENAGWLTSHPEDEAEWLAGAPPGRGPGRRRTYFQLTPDGFRATIHELAQPRRNRNTKRNPAAQHRRETP